MDKKTSHYVKFLIVSIFFSLSSCSSGCATFSNVSDTDHKELPRRAFVQIQHLVELEGCGLDERTGKEKCQKATMRYVSSGSFVFHSEVSEAVSYVMTAGHSCRSRVPKVQMIEGFKIRNLGSKFKIKTLEGSVHNAKVVMTNKRFDLCLLRADNILSPYPKLSVSEKEPKIGETVTNLAAPHGLFWNGTVLIFKGQFSGYHHQGYSVYTIPTKPGSSGSPIINSKNKIVGLIFAGYPVLESIGLSSPLAAIKVFLKKAIAKGEMEIWEKDKKPEEGTQVDRLWIQEMRLKLDEVFGN